MQLLLVGWGDSLETTRDLEERDSQDSMGVTLDEMTSNEEKKLVESTSSRYTGPHEDGWSY